MSKRIELLELDSWICREILKILYHLQPPHVQENIRQLINEAEKAEAEIDKKYAASLSMNFMD